MAIGCAVICLFFTLQRLPSEERLYNMAQNNWTHWQLVNGSIATTLWAITSLSAVLSLPSFGQ